MQRQKNSFLLVLTCALATVLMASRCSDDDEPAPSKAKTEAPESAIPPTSLDEDTLKNNPESGVEKDPIGETLGGDDSAAPLDDVPPPGGDDSQMLDDPSFEPEPVPEEATDL